MKRILKLTLMIMMISVLIFSSVHAEITEQQGNDVAEFAKKFIEEGNSRKDEKGFPLLTYALTGSFSKNIQLRSDGYNGKMTYIKNNGYYISGGRYLELGNKWAMDCGTTVLFMLKNTLGFEILNSYGEPWHVIDIYNDAAKGANSQYFDLIYRNVSVGKIDYSKLKKGDVIGYYTSHGNHGMLYLGDGYIAHANRDMIKSYGNDKVSGFQVGKLNKYFLPGTAVRVMRIKDGIIPTDLVVNGKITWPDTGETVDLLNRTVNVEQIDEVIKVAENEEKAVIPEYTEEDLISKQENSVAARETLSFLSAVAQMKNAAQSAVLARISKRFVTSQLDFENSVKPIYYYSQYVDSKVKLASL